MYTGFDFNKDFELRVDKVFNDYYSEGQLSAFFKRCFQLAVTTKYQELVGQKRFDQVRGLIVTGKSVPATSGRVMLQPISVLSYINQTGIVTTAYPHNLSASDVVDYDFIPQSGLNQSGQATVFAVISDTAFSLTPATKPSMTNFKTGNVTTPQTLADYLHLFAVTPVYHIPAGNISTIISKPSSVVVVMEKLSQLRTGTKIHLSGVNAPSSINGTWYVKQVGQKSFQLYSDKALLDPVLGTAKYTSGGAIYYVSETKAFQFKPDQLNYLDEPSQKFPRWAISDNAILFEPEVGLQSAYFDYLTQLPVEIDPENTTTDLLLYCSYEFWMYVIDVCATQFDLNTRNAQAIQIDGPQVVINQ